MNGRSSTRVYYIDWLRILAVLLLFPFHTLRVFDEADPFYVKALPVSFWVGRALKLISVWHMPLLFFLAGCSTYFALQKRHGGQYSWERVKRLLVPFVFGFFILIPPQTWFGGRFNSSWFGGHYVGSYWHYLSSGDFLRFNVQDGGDYFGGFGIGQLWFILFLLLISMIVLPLLLWGVRSGARKFQAFSRRLARPVWWLLPIVVLYFSGWAPDLPGGPFVFYLLVFVFGFIAVCSPEFMESAQRYRIPALIVGLGLTAYYAVGTSFRESFADVSWQRQGLEFGGTVAMWLMLMGLLGFGKRYLDRTSRAQRYLAESSYPVYIIHQTVIVTIAFFLVRWAAPRPALWVILLVASVLGTFALYEIVRRVGVLRVLCGMRLRPRPQAAPALAAAVPTGPATAAGQAAGEPAPALATAPVQAKEPKNGAER